MNNESQNTLNIGTGILILLCVLSLFFFLGDTLFNTRGEPREAIVAYSMLEHSNWVLPINNGDEIAFKPPFLHWCIAVFSTLTGKVTEFTARFPSALSTTLMVIFGYIFYAHRRSTKVALLMGLLTLTNFEVHRAAYACRVDMLLSALIVLSIFALYRWIEKDRKGIPWLALTLMAGAALTKGPIGALLPCGVAGSFLLLRGHNIFKLMAQFLLLAIVALLPLFLWYYLAYLQPHGGDRFLQLIYEENILRFTGGMTYTSHLNPWYYNVQTIITGFLPYTLIPLIALPSCWKYLKEALTKSSLKKFFTGKTFEKMSDIDLYTLLGFLVIFIFYCIPASKRSVYLLPAYPFIAYFLAEFILWLSNKHNKVVLAFGHFIAFLSFLLIGIFIVVRTIGIPESVFSGKHATENLMYLHALEETPIGIMALISISLPVLAAVYFEIKRYKSRHSEASTQLVYTILAIVFCLFFALDGFYQPTILNKKSDKDIAEKIKEEIPTGRIYSYREEYIDANRMHPFTINFYMDDRVIPIDKATTAPKEGYLIVSGNSMDRFVKEYPQYQAEMIFKTEKRSCDDRQPVCFYHFELKK